MLFVYNHKCIYKQHQSCVFTALTIIYYMYGKIGQVTRRNVASPRRDGVKRIATAKDAHIYKHIRIYIPSYTHCRIRRSYFSGFLCFLDSCVGIRIVVISIVTLPPWMNKQIRVVTEEDTRG